MNKNSVSKFFRSLREKLNEALGLYGTAMRLIYG